MASRAAARPAAEWVRAETQSVCTLVTVDVEVTSELAALAVAWGAIVDDEASSRTMCTFVPPMPKEDMPQRRAAVSDLDARRGATHGADAP
eukprot:scaffold211702_cov27-Tisochrysis_lutea.AAC.8